MKKELKEQIYSIIEQELNYDETVNMITEIFDIKTSNLQASVNKQNEIISMQLDALRSYEQLPSQLESLQKENKAIKDKKNKLHDIITESNNNAAHWHELFIKTRSQLTTSEAKLKEYETALKRIKLATELGHMIDPKKINEILNPLTN